MARIRRIRPVRSRSTSGPPPKTAEEEDTVWRKIHVDRETREHFKLAEDPFKHPPRNEREIFVPAAWKELRGTVMDAPNHKSLVAIIGPSTAGKSTFLQWLFDRDDRDDDLLILSPDFVDKREVGTAYLYEFILRALGATRGGVVPISKADRHDMLLEHLATLESQGKRVALVLDDAQQLHPDDLLCVKGWVELRKEFRRVLGVILVGQEELGVRLGLPRFRAIRSRAQMIVWPPFDRHVKAFLGFKLELVGSSFDRVFADDAPAAIARRIKGDNRRYQITPAEVESCAALAMRCAREQGARHVTAALVREMSLALVRGDAAEDPAPAPLLARAAVA